MKYHVLLLLIAASVLLVESSPGKSKSNAVQAKKHQTLEVVPVAIPKSSKPSEILPIVKKNGKPTRRSRQTNQIAFKPRPVVKRPSRRDGNRRPVHVQYRPVQQYRPRPVHHINVRQSSNRPKPVIQHSGHKPSNVNSQHVKPSVNIPVRTSVPVGQKSPQPQQAAAVKPNPVNINNQDRFAGGRRL